MRTFRSFRVLALVLTAGLMLAACDTVVKSPTGTSTTVVLIRHADRSPAEKDLNAKGRARAAALPAALEGMPIDAIYSPDLKRNLDTVAPLAAQRGLTVKVIKVSWVADRLVGENPGKTVLWVGNTTNLKSIYANLGGTGEPPINYGDLYVMRIPDKGPAQVTRKRFGP